MAPAAGLLEAKLWYELIARGPFGGLRTENRRAQAPQALPAEIISFRTQLLGLASHGGLAGRCIMHLQWAAGAWWAEVRPHSLRITAELLSRANGGTKIIANAAWDPAGPYSLGQRRIMHLAWVSGA